jgi:hypothetical protein
VDADALRAALDRLVARGVLRPEQADAVLAEVAVPAAAPAGPRRLLGEIAGYLGASFVVGATLLFLGEQWDELGRGGRFAILAAMAAILFGCGLAIRFRWASPDSVRRRLASTLMTGGAAAAAFAGYVLTTRDDGIPLAASVTGLVVVVAGYLLARSALGQIGAAVAAFAVCASLLDLGDDAHAWTLGLAALALGAVWAALAGWRVVTERRLGLAIAAGFGLLGAQLMVIDDVDPLGYVLTALVAAGCFAAYTRIRDWVLLAGGVAGATLVVPEFLYDVTEGSLGASGVMLVAGVTLLAGSLAGLRIRRHPAEIG